MHINTLQVKGTFFITHLFVTLPILKIVRGIFRETCSSYVNEMLNPKLGEAKDYFSGIKMKQNLKCK